MFVFLSVWVKKDPQSRAKVFKLCTPHHFYHVSCDSANVRFVHIVVLTNVALAENENKWIICIKFTKANI